MTTPHIFRLEPNPSETKLKKFYETLREGRLTTTYCGKCSLTHWPPRMVCPNCMNEDLNWIELSGKGRLYAFTEVMDGAPLGMEDELPYIIGVVELDEGIRLLARIVDTKYGELRIGQRVVFTIKPRGDFAVLSFRPE